MGRCHFIEGRQGAICIEGSKPQGMVYEMFKGFGGGIMFSNYVSVKVSGQDFPLIWEV